MWVNLQTIFLLHRPGSWDQLFSQTLRSPFCMYIYLLINPCQEPFENCIKSSGIAAIEPEVIKSHQNVVHVCRKKGTHGWSGKDMALWFLSVIKWQIGWLWTRVYCLNAKSKKFWFKNMQKYATFWWFFAKMRKQFSIKILVLFLCEMEKSLWMFNKAKYWVGIPALKQTWLFDAKICGKNVKHFSKKYQIFFAP